ncbi:MULE transposase domain [Phytophthora cactorum]|nr:MULE transposase domain [Phytophthora cactorum]
MKAAVASASSDWDPIFVTDRQKGIFAAATELYPNRGHRFCVIRIIGNAEKMSSRLPLPSKNKPLSCNGRSEFENDYKFYRSQLSDTRPLAAQDREGALGHLCI